MTLPRHHRAFRVEPDAAAIADLRQRLARTRWPDQLPDAGWDYGTELDSLRQLCERWSAHDFDGYAARLNAHPQFLTEIDGVGLHYYHLRSPEPDAQPLLLTHGWPGSVVEFLETMAPLADPRAHGGDPRDAFHVVVPSLPGYGHSGPTTRRGIDGRVIAGAFDALMQQLGYTRYFAQGGDWGSLVTTLLGAEHAAHVKAIHLNFVTAAPPEGTDPQAGLTDEEREGLRRTQAFNATGTGYQHIQRTRPQTLAYGLSDSPSGLAGWLLEKFHGWSGRDDQGRPLIRTQGLLDNLSLYWFTGTINASMRLYYEHTGAGRFRPAGRVDVPTGHTRYPHEIVQVPRAWVEPRFNLRYWKQMPRGGHFAAMEVPQLFVEDLRAFFRDYRDA